MTRRGSAWLSGLVVGVGAGALMLTLPIVGWLIVIAFVIGAVISRAAVAAIGGLAIGAGAAWLGVLGQSIVACRSFTGPGRECIVPELTPWLASAVAMVIAGALATIAAVSR